MKEKRKDRKTTLRLPNALAGGRKEPIVEDKLDKARLREIRNLLVKGELETVVFVYMLRNSTDNVRYVASLLKDKNVEVRLDATRTLALAIKSRVDISIAIPELRNTLRNDERSVRWKAAWTLADAASIGLDISIAVPALVNALKDEYVEVRDDAAKALRAAATNGTAAIRGAIIKAVYEFQSSEWFMIEAARNSRIYIELVGQLDAILQAVRETEQREAA